MDLNLPTPPRNAPMPDKAETWAGLSAWLHTNWPTVYASGLASVIAALRVMYGGGTLRRVALEAPLCGAIALAAGAGVELVGLPSTAVPFFGGMIGLLGVEGTRALAQRLLDRKAGRP
jgi:lambda family phage holin